MTTITYSPVGTASASALASNPLDVTCGSHPFSTGDAVLIVGYTQMTAANGAIFNILSSDANSLFLRGMGRVPKSIDGTISPYGTAETSGGTCVLALSGVLDVPVVGETIDITLAGTWVATVLLEREVSPYSGSWREIGRFTASTGYAKNFVTTRKNERFRFRMIDWTSDSGDMVLTVADGATVGQQTDFSGDVTVAGTLAVTGAQTFTGNTTLAGTLAVTGAVTFTVALSAGITTVDAIVGRDNSLTIDGIAGSAGAGGVVTITGGAGDSGAGGAVTLAGGAGDTTASVGGQVNVTAGAGASTGLGGAVVVTGGAGAANSGATAAAGGADSWTTGAGGAGTGQNGGASGALTVGTGAAGTSDTGQAGASGALILETAAGGAASGAAGVGGASGALTIRTGAGGAASDSSSGNAGNAGDMVLDGGDGGAGTSGDGGDGGDITITGGLGGAAAAAGDDGGEGGNVALVGGVGGADGQGGSGIGAKGGDVTLTGGVGGLGSTGEDGGDAIINSGAGAGSGLAGVTAIRAGGQAAVLMGSSAIVADSGATTTMTAAILTSGIHVKDPAGSITYTFPTGALINAQFATQPAAGDQFFFTLINSDATGGADITFAAGDNGTLVGYALIHPVADVAEGNPHSATFLVRNDAGGADWTFYRIS